MADAERPYLPAAGYHWALPLYDPLQKFLGAEKAKRVLLDQAALRPGYRVLDIGCGTGSLAVLIKRLHSDTEVVGIDPDPNALKRAQSKAGRAALSIRFDQGSADELPYEDGHFDRVFSSFMFHHLQEHQRDTTAREVRRVLAPRGSFHLLDFACPEDRPLGWWDRLVFSNPHFRGNSASRILTILAQAGFASATKAMDGAISFGLLHVGYFKAFASSADGED